MIESLRSISDSKILSDTDAIIVQDRKLTLRLLVHLHEIERRKLYLTRGHGSMFDYCTRHLRLSEPAAVRRIKTARCLARFPELYGLLESGEVSLSTVSVMARILKPENCGVILARVRGKSRRDVERVVSEYEPRAVLPPDRVRTITVPIVERLDAVAAGRNFTVTGDGKKSSTVEELTQRDLRGVDGDKSPHAMASSGELAGTARLERRALVQFAAREIVINKLERVRSIASHRLLANAPLEQVIEFLADYFTEREDPAERHARRGERKQKADSEVASPADPSTPSEKLGRSIPAHVRDEVFVRDGHQCTYHAPNGKQCGSTHVLQIDHITPVALGGLSTLDNLRLLCAQHNRLEAERLVGRFGPSVPPRPKRNDRK